MTLRLALAVILFSSTAFAQTTTPKPPAAQALTNDGVIKLVKAGLSEDFIIASIKNAPKKAFDVSPDGVIALKAAGVTERVMLIMSGIEPPPLDAASAARPPSAATTTVPSPVSNAKLEPANATSVRGIRFLRRREREEVALDPVRHYRAAKSAHSGWR